MTQPEAHQFITYDGVEYWLSDGHERHVLTTPGDMGLPPLQNITDDHYNGDGVTLINTFARQRRVGIRIDQSACDRDEYHAIRAALLDIARPNRGGVGTYIFYRSDGSKRAIRGLPSTPQFSETSTDEYEELAFQITFDLDCFDPAWFDPDLVTVLAQGCPLVAAYNESNLDTSLPIMLGMARRMVSYWSYDGTFLADDYNGNTLTNNNGAGPILGRVGQAANFVSASNMSLSHTDNASLSQTGDFSFLIWYHPTTLGTTQRPIRKWDFANDNSYLLEKDNVTDELTWNVSNNGTAVVFVTASTYGGLLQTWYLAHAYHDVGTNIGLGINGVYNTQAHTTGVFDGTQDFVLGNTVDGALDETALWKRLLTAAEYQHYYNGGLGREFEEIVPAIRIAQPFVITETTQIGTVQGWLQRVGNVLNHSVFARIYDSSGGSPNTSLYETNQLTSELPGTIANGATYTHTPNCRISFTVNAIPTVTGIVVRFRWQDATHFWMVQITTAGTLSLFENNAGFTLRASAVGVVTGEAYVAVTCQNETITGYVNGTQVWQYTSAANFKTETDGNVADTDAVGSFSNLRAFVYAGNAQALASSGFDPQPLVFASPPTLTPGTYWLSIESSLPESVTNYINWASDSSGGYAGGTAKAYRNGAWSDTGLSMIFEVFEYCPDDRQLVFPITFPIQFDGDDVFDSEVISYPGTWYSYPTFIIDGPFDGFRIRHKELEKDIFYLGSASLGESLTLNLADRTLTNSAGDNLWNLLGPLTDIQDFRLQPNPVVASGINTLEFFAGSFRDGYTQFTVQYETRYIGI